jgi:hypothetical protein
VTQIKLLAEPDDALDRVVRFELGRGYALHLPRGPRAPGTRYHRGTPIKQVNLRDKAERRLLAVELMRAPWLMNQFVRSMLSLISPLCFRNARQRGHQASR